MIIEATRSMLSDSHLPTQLWAEAVNTASFTQHRLLIVKKFNKTAYELFHGRKSSIKFLHIFGCQFFILNNRDTLGKFDPKADDGIFLRYSSISKEYRKSSALIQRGGLQSTDVGASDEAISDILLLNLYL
ncbi:hypothetical protein L6452_38940 [Arctium lappa]|uniref:Uncharacterized protein n=1 Tax=Arctium lappa TaxID=4217 RepID=A0ACB8XQG3_ARCLA|nr:hypothetical protein L6452_38940 [Arctium lappa]